MSDTALIIVDLQNDYFENGKWALNGINEAAANAANVLAAFRERNLPVIHVRHEFIGPDAPFFEAGSEGAQIHNSLTPADGEPVVLKHEANSFQHTELKILLEQQGIKKLVIIGAMSHMCVDAITRAAKDFGYENTVLHDACATLDLTFNGITVPSEHVHAAFMAALQFAYAEVVSTEAWLEATNA